MIVPLITSRLQFALVFVSIYLWWYRLVGLQKRCTKPKHDSVECVEAQSCCDSYLLRVVWPSHPAAELVHAERSYFPAATRQQQMDEEKEIFRDKLGTELNISSPNNTMSNSHLINKTFSISINADLQKARQARVRNDECTAAESISHWVHAARTLVCGCVCQLLLPTAQSFVNSQRTWDINCFSATIP